MTSRISHADSRVVIDFADQMRQHFGVGLGAEMMFTFLEQGILDLCIIFNHSIVDEGELAAFVEMRVRILIGWLAVSSPTRVTDSIAASGRVIRHQFGKPRDAPRALASLDVIAIDDRDASGVVTAILKPAQAIEQDGSGFRSPDVSDDAAHDLGGNRDTERHRKQGGQARSAAPPSPALALAPDPAPCCSREQEQD